jgi:radical SAM protein with 4Fe4S-binding SPASM domain
LIRQFKLISLRIFRTFLKKYVYLLFNQIQNTSFGRDLFYKSKLKKYAKDLFEIALGDSFDQVHTIYIETLTACNLRCSYCPNSVYERGLIKNNQEMETKLFYKIIDELADLNWVGEIQPHSYGEPLLDQRLPSFCSYIIQKLPLAKIAIFSNGELLNIDWYKKLVSVGVKRFSVTQHLKNQSKGTLDVIRYREKHGYDNVEFTYTRLKHINSRGGLVDVDEGELRQECNYPDHHVGISFDGQILICCNDYLNEAKVGDVKDEKLIDIWQKPIYKDIRTNIRSGNFTLDICKNCTDGKVYT